MSKLPEVTHQDGVIYKGDALLLEVTLHDDPEKTVLTDLTGKTPQASLMDSKGAKVADLLCAYLEASEAKPKRIAVLFPSVTTAACAVGKSYPYKLSLLDSGGEPYRVLMGVMEASL